MTDAGRQDASADRQKLERLTVLAFGAVILLGGLNGIAAKQILRELEPFWSGVAGLAEDGGGVHVEFRHPTDPALRPAGKVDVACVLYPDERESS